MLGILKTLLGDISLFCFVVAFVSFLGHVGVLHTHGALQWDRVGFFCLIFGYVTKFLNRIIKDDIG